MTDTKNYRHEVLVALRNAPSPMPVRKLLRLFRLAKPTKALRSALFELEREGTIVRGVSGESVIWLLQG
ncbi:hypothetical protein p1B260 (plasmid) [Aromatoleum aromaticum EbN1]|uniref:Uncharacterized protein n=1 Tax=Aromatoleum aromaticum (strain DSM 19018 / LMG 30748 / EbN1) TaxID=76114 RepID=Q5NWW8_AROAE|nr:hypothetical protein p1B260 [Aromatoleum aromaticum EbN1]